MKVEEAIELINSKKLDALWRVEDEINDIKLVEKGSNLDEYRWFSYATNYYKCEDGFIGVEGPYQLFSESQMWSDTAEDYGYCNAFEAEEYTTVSYRPKE